MSAVVVAFLLCTVACFVAHVAIVRSVVRQGSSPRDASVPRPRLGVELLWAVLPLLALSLVLTATWARVRENAKPKPAEIMKVAR